MEIFLRFVSSHHVGSSPDHPFISFEKLHLFSHMFRAWIIVHTFRVFVHQTQRKMLGSLSEVNVFIDSIVDFMEQAAGVYEAVRSPGV
jgi:hypothetical protein